jgi:hypothetical protein
LFDHGCDEIGSVVLRVPTLSWIGSGVGAGVTFGSVAFDVDWGHRRHDLPGAGAVLSHRGVGGGVQPSAWNIGSGGVACASSRGMTGGGAHGRSCSGSSGAA